MDRGDERPSGPDEAARATRASDAEVVAAGMSGLGFAGLGVQFAASLLLSYYAGQWLDRRLGTAPVFLLVLVFVGGGASFYAMYRQMMAAQRREDAARAAARETARERAARDAGGTGST